MTLMSIKQLRMLTEEERYRLASGKRPKPWLTSQVQRFAVRVLAGFFALMLTFTLLSRAADGFTVPRVTVDQPQTGILTQRVNLSGGLKPQGNLNLTLPVGVNVTRIVAEEGQRVKSGDVLLELDKAALDVVLEELKNKEHILDLKIASAAQGNSEVNTNAILSAQDTLDAAKEDYSRLLGRRGQTELRTKEDLNSVQTDYEKAAANLEKAKVKAKKDMVQAAQDNVDDALQVLRETQDAADDSIRTAKQALDSAENQYKSGKLTLSQAKEQLEKAKQALAKATASGDDTAIQNAQAQVDTAQAAVNSANASLEVLDDNCSYARKSLNSVRSSRDDKIRNAEYKWNKAKEKLNKAKTVGDVSEESLVVSAQAAFDAAEKALKSTKRSVEDSATDTENQLLAARRAVKSANRALADAKQTAKSTRHTNEIDRQQAQIDRLGNQSEKRILQEQIDLLKAVSDAGGKLTAPIAGTVQSILSDTGKTKDEVKAAVLARSDQGFVFEAKMTQKEAEKLVVGDKGQLDFTRDGKSEDVDAVLSSIGVPDDKGMVSVTAELPSGSYPSGASGKLEISKRSQQYKQVLKLGALHSGSDGEYVLVLRVHQNVMGAEQTAAKVPVKVLEKNSEQVAVESDSLMTNDQVIIGSSKPVAEGDRVRLEEQKS